MDPSIQDDAVLWEETEVIPYTHFSLSLSKTRRFARWVAWNIDGATIKLLSRTNLTFTKDPRLASDSQIGNELYSGNRLDRGHIARRADLTWGPLPEAQQANQDSFYYTNITPQMDDFNQSKQNGIWGRLENALYEDVAVQDLRASVFGGPVLHPDDRIYRGVALPSEYWKLLAYQNQGTLKARAFLLTQDLDHLRALLALDEFRVYQITMDELEQRTQLHFPQNVKQAGQLTAVREISERKPLDASTDIEW
ncbi:DNA/RNA non-specific endonuclease [Arthrobacter sp. AQ5-05]|uniref:DNA/RNA non-specific endonuclease n=1 Tax=Arthrobacter sp. AQ5-05 TaxID=2184581 RepID=UPI0025710AD2|nr:DNA/RNA non-specific endonuclease [Arthrobacter sp. AQ5-05]